MLIAWRFEVYWQLLGLATDRSDKAWPMCADHPVAGSYFECIDCIHLKILSSLFFTTLYFFYDFTFNTSTQPTQQLRSDAELCSRTWTKFADAQSSTPCMASREKIKKTCDMSEKEVSRNDKARFNKGPSKNSLSSNADITGKNNFKACWRAGIQKNHESLLRSFSHHGCRCWCTDEPHAASFGRGCSADLREQTNDDNQWETCGDIDFQPGRICFPFLSLSLHFFVILKA